MLVRRLRTRTTVISFKIFFNKLIPISTESWNKLSALFFPKVLKKGDHFTKEGQTVKEIGFLFTFMA
jgi:hypothetical protein